MSAGAAPVIGLMGVRDGGRGGIGGGGVGVWVA